MGVQRLSGRSPSDSARSPRRVLGHAPVAEVEDPVRVGVRVRPVGHHEHGATGVTERGQMPQHLDAVLGIEVPRGFISEDQRRASHERAPAREGRLRAELDLLQDRVLPDESQRERSEGVSLPC